MRLENIRNPCIIYLGTVHPPSTAKVLTTPVPARGGNTAAEWHRTMRVSCRRVREDRTVSIEDIAREGIGVVILVLNRSHKPTERSQPVEQSKCYGPKQEVLAIFHRSGEKLHSCNILNFMLRWWANIGSNKALSTFYAGTSPSGMQAYWYLLLSCYVITSLNISSTLSNASSELLIFHRRSDSHYELVDSGSQWREVQRKQAGDGISNSIQQANVISSRRSGYVNSGLETESETSYQNRNRRHRKHRSRSRSPDSKTWLPDELKKHLEFDLIDTTGMSESQLREIPYTVVQTNHAKQLKLKHLQRGKGYVSAELIDF